jgi:hypothetical protein
MTAVKKATTNIATPTSTASAPIILMRPRFAVKVSDEVYQNAISVSYRDNATGYVFSYPSLLHLLIEPPTSDLLLEAVSYLKTSKGNTAATYFPASYNPNRFAPHEILETILSNEEFMILDQWGIRLEYDHPSKEDNPDYPAQAKWAYEGAVDSPMETGIYRILADYPQHILMHCAYTYRQQFLLLP